ncbi:MAG TPA: peptidylprolyl isomerase [Mycobacteriales bacterium]|nr:peptidylprolyl isomerase [Mycobacteriales bacterium]
MPSSKRREREIARRRYERRMARRQEAQARARRRNRTIGAIAATLALVGGLSYLAVDLSGSPSRSAASPRATPTPVATLSAPPAVFNGTCSFRAATGGKVKNVGIPPTRGISDRTPEVMTMVTNRGTIKIRLNTAKAPCTAFSFRYLASKGYFDHSPCHRLTTTSIYVLQCGDPFGTGTGGPGYTIPDENLAGATYPAGTVAMANTGTAHTGGSQFFLVYKNTQLPPQYTPFGTIVSGLPVLATVARAGSTPAGDGKPKLSVEILRLTVSNG